MGTGAPTSPLWPADNSAVTAHISMLQAIIARLATNSASCKTWCLALVGALLSFAAGTKVPAIAAFAIVPIVMFAFLDANYLAQERAYRVLFAKIVGKIRDRSYAISDSFEAKAPIEPGALARAFRSWSIWPFYLGLLAAYAVAMGSGWIGLPSATEASAAPKAAVAGPSG
ncbi:MAG: hypothetical protein QOJ27_2013 [Sphingomonadales bacterium]|nr:hypothetical protein [Sphingomonadales bacterium]